MSVMNSKQFSSKVNAIKNNSAKFAEDVHEVLITATFYAHTTGDIRPFNRVLEAVGDGTRKKGITMWIELIAGIGRVKDGEIVLNKKARNEAGITSEERFADIEPDLRAVRWDQVVGKEKVASVFDEGRYMNGVYSKLTTNGYAGLADHLKRAELEYLAKNAPATADQ